MYERENLAQFILVKTLWRILRVNNWFCAASNFKKDEFSEATFLNWAVHSKPDMWQQMMQYEL